ncbi:DUF2497 domain-containing protein [Methylosinus trichosporium OB3b]|uniref:DUF2497 domain-containing protein n=2 Tax=Methylosinus TaxID=425 RepID=A0A2D2CZR0_METT3|nr:MULTISPECIES: DUF2497 domain-containing protein [Methylosinus]ATQ68230.1 DUF2497 domain-containing protein [Methylosinus trichosporium OB3b]OBS50592.1 hypothetical protein A8B73_20735 [Methylosinus sp. 3S-1]
MSAMNASINPTTLDAERRAHEPSMEEILASIRRIIADDDALPVIRREREKEKRPLTAAEAPKQAEPRVAPPVAAPEPRRPAPAVPAVAAPEPTRPPVAALAPIIAAESDADLAEETTEPDDSDAFWLRGSQRPDERHAPDDSDEPSSEQSRWAIDAEQDADEPEDDEAVDAPDRSEPVMKAAEPEEEPEAEDASPALVSADAANSVASHFQALAASIVLSESDLIERYARDLLRPLLKQWLDDNLPHIVERLVRVEIERVARGRR